MDQKPLSLYALFKLTWSTGNFYRSYLILVQVPIRRLHATQPRNLARSNPYKLVNIG